MIGVVACSNPTGNAPLEGVVSGCRGVDTGELIIEMVADVWHLTALVYKLALRIWRGGPACTHQSALTHTALYFAFMKHGNNVLVSRS